MKSEIREWIDVIGENANPEDMEKLGDILAELICSLKESHPDLYKKYKMCIYEMAYGKVLTREMAEDWVSHMDPPSKWDFDTTSMVKKQHNVNDIDDISFYVVMNMLHSDMSNVLGDGDNASSLMGYIQATKDWLHDKDASDEKLYNYWKYVV